MAKALHFLSFAQTFEQASKVLDLLSLSKWYGAE
jgi:hypothetical protein